MKLTLILLLAFSLGASADGFSQTKMSVDFKDTDLKHALATIQKNSSYYFVYSPRKMPSDVNVNFKANNEDVTKILDGILSNSGLTYQEMEDHLIVISLKDKPVAFAKVTGTVVDEKGDPLVGAAVKIKGTNTATSTDVNGGFTIDAPDGATLVISFIGYISQEVPVTGGKMNIHLTPEQNNLNEVVVVGYGVQKKETLTGSVAVVKGSEILKSPATNVSNSLAGRLPGVVAVNSSGEPGNDGSSIRIRGVNTFGNPNPLVVVDGIPGRSLERIDPSTVETISVLKDASAAIYGAQAANGVILITTKRGKTGKPSVNFTYNQGFGKPTRVPKMADAAQYATLINEIALSQGQPAKYTQNDIDLYRSGTDPWKHPNTDWFKETLRPWSMQNYGNASVSGGTEDVKYFVSLSSRTQDGYYRNSGAKYNQYDLRSNLDAKINKYLSLRVDLSGRMEDRNYPARSEDDIFRMVMRGKPNLPAYWPNGMPGPDIEYGNNPVVISTKATGYDRDKRYVVNTNFSLTLKVPGVNGLTVTGNAAIDKNFQFTKTFRTPWYLYTWDGTVDASGTPVLSKGKRGFENPELSESMSDGGNILLNGLVNYEKTFGNGHNFRILAGAEKINGQNDRFNAYRRNFISSSIDQLFAGAVDQFLANGGTGDKNARLNYFGRVNYAYQDKYLLEFVWRYQGSYIFDKANRFGFFPGVSVGYVVSKEDFWKNITSINYLKLRGSWGATGNDAITPFRYLSTYGLGSLSFLTNNGDILNQTLSETGVPNVNTTWEKAIQRDFGFDARLLNDRLSVTADYFYNTRSNILTTRNASVPNSTGISLPPENIGKTENRGFDFSVDYQNSIGQVSYQVGINGGYAKNKILFWDEAPGAPIYQQSTGRPIDSQLYYEAIGIYRDQAQVNSTPHWSNARPGDVIFKDINNDGKIDAMDRNRIDKSGTPTLTGGFTLALKYKSFDFSALVQGAAGAVQYVTTESGEVGNYLQSFYNDHWTPQNIDATAPRAFNNLTQYWVSQGNTYWLRKSDYIRLKNIEVGYSLKSALKKWGVQNFRIYANAYNLFTYSPDLKDFDPEVSRGSNGAGQSYPLQKIVNVGLSVGF